MCLRWFVSARVGNGLRLTDFGKLAFECADIYSCDIVIDKMVSMTSGWLLDLSHFIYAPFHLSTKIINGKMKPIITIFDDGLPTIINLRDGIAEYINGVKEMKRND